ncbi:hypothetical protein SmJEL517_g04606 [Synchytrium microbalum]|uniref:Uncharacterized protein n=1 Tax=Synchytrium microbalum TaxID=1806994 RepID=A0A507BR82_9FUNG|nr:uncharacterized protein SmJEL517_g04606 [Synchytrium microbalum]TPX32220.1 hypothetical protein SmJEL517_g04606 [Synchytrium microbalum]
MARLYIIFMEPQPSPTLRFSAVESRTYSGLPFAIGEQNAQQQQIVNVESAPVNPFAADPATRNVTPTQHMAHHNIQIYLPNGLWLTFMGALFLRILWNCNRTLVVDIILDGNYTLDGTQQFENATGIPFDAVVLVSNFLGFLCETSMFSTMLLFAQGYCIVRAQFFDLNQSRVFAGLVSLSLLLQVVLSGYGQLYAIVLAFLQLIVIRILLHSIAHLKSFYAGLTRSIRLSRATNLIDASPTEQKLDLMTATLTLFYIYLFAVVGMLVATRVTSVSNVAIIAEVVDFGFVCSLMVLLRLRGKATRRRTPDETRVQPVHAEAVEAVKPKRSNAETKYYMIQYSAETRGAATLNPVINQRLFLASPDMLQDEATLYVGEDQ